MDPLEQRVNGYSLADNAEIMSMMSLLKAEHGEPGYHPHFLQFLRSRGWTEAAWMESYNHWYAQMQANPDLAAKFHTFMSQHHTRQLTARQPDVSGDALEGVSLEAYAKISARSQTGAAIEGLVAAEGLTMDQWMRGQAAWGQRMGSVSPSDPILLQYGQLYQKWSPNHAASMEAATAAHLREAGEREGRGGGMSQDLTLDNAHQFFEHADLRVRVRGVRELIRIWELQDDLRDDRARQLVQHAYEVAVHVLQYGAGEDKPGYMALTQHVDAMDIHAWSAMHNQEDEQHGTTDMVWGALQDLAGAEFMSPAQNEAAQQAIRQAIARVQPRAQRVEQAFQGVRDETKRASIRSLMDDYRQLLEDLTEALEDWDYEGPQAAAGPSPAPSSSPAPAAAPSAPQTAVAPAKKPDDPILAMLKSLPIIGDLLKMLGL